MYLNMYGLTIMHGRRALFNLLQGTNMPATIKGANLNHFSLTMIYSEGQIT